MKKLFLFFILVLTIGLGLQATRAEENTLKGRLKEKIKERWLKKQDGATPKTNIDADARITKPGDYTISIQHGGKTRMYKLHVPSKYNPEAAIPLVFAFHGGGGDMNYQSNDKFYKQISKSEAENFVVVFPNGSSQLNNGKLATWNAGQCCGLARDEKIDDVGFIKQAVEHIKKQLNIDTSKIFAIGMSNGGMMSYRLACELSDTFKAIASVAGTDNTSQCTPKNPISILHIHAKDDDRVLFNGGSGNKFRDPSLVNDFNSVPKTISKWVKTNGCSETPKRILEKEGAYCELYTKCQKNTEVQLCVTDTGGHSWPGGVKPRGEETPSQALSANDVIWDFFKNK